MFPTESAVDLAAIRASLAAVGPASTASAMADQLRVLRELSSVLAAAEASVTAAFVAARRAEQTAAGVPARRVGQGIPLELGLARRESPGRAGRYAGFAGVLVRELPATFAALRAGETTEWRAMLIARETGWLSAEDRARVDADLGPRLGGLGDRQVHAEAARLAYRLDPRGKIEQLRRAVGGRRVTLLPADDGMTRLIATLPLTQGVAVIAALNKAAGRARAAGDPRSRGQVMADVLVELVTGQRTADRVPLRVDLIITDQALLGTGPGAAEPATVSGHGPVPAAWARDLITRTATSPTDTPAATPAETTAARATQSPAAAAASPAMVKIRRLFTDPAGKLVTMETASRDFTPAMAAFVRLRDQWCTTPWCGAPIRHIDHLHPWADGGPTSLANAGGKCEACNYATETPGWQRTPLADGTIRVTTPTGHDTTSFTHPRAPGPPDHLRPQRAHASHSMLERSYRRRLARHTRLPAARPDAQGAVPPQFGESRIDFVDPRRSARLLDRAAPGGRQDHRKGRRPVRSATRSKPRTLMLRRAV